jgi:hypothetical protein
LRPLVIATLYSQAFQPASLYLRWTLAGDYFKVTAWVLAMPMLASAHMRALVATDALVQTVFLGASWLLATVRPVAEGAAMGFAVSYVVCLSVSWWYAARYHGFRPTPELAALWIGGLVLVAAAAGSTWDDQSVSWPKAIAWIALTGGAAAWAGWRLMRMGEVV